MSDTSFLLSSKKDVSNTSTSFFSKPQLYCIIALSILFALFVVYRIVLTVVFCDEVGAYKGFNIPDFMINYQSGFIRRGMIGEILYQIFQVHPFAVHKAVTYFNVAIFSIFAIFTLRTLWKLRFFPLMSCAICLGCMPYRRDYLVILLAYIALYYIFEYYKKQQKRYLIANVFICTLSVFLYEPSFFFMTPISMLFAYYSISQIRQKKENSPSKLKDMGVFLLPILSMALVCCVHGDKDAANIIWGSWDPMFKFIGEQYCPEEIPAAISFLGLPAMEVMQSHFTGVYGLNDGIDLNVFLGAILFFAGFYYLTTRNPKWVKNPSETANTETILGSVYLFQFVCLLPMFTVLSCDIGRTINYVIYSSFYITYLISKNKIEIRIPYLFDLSSRIQGFISRNVILSNVWTYIVILMLVPFGLCGPAELKNPLCMEYISIFIPKIMTILANMGL